MEYVLHIFILFGIFAILAMSLDLLSGHTGLISLAHAAFYGLGAYASALLTTRVVVPFLLAIVVAMFLASMVSLTVSFASSRLHGDYFAIATFGFQIIAFNIFNNWTAVTNGPLGIAGIPRPTVFGFSIQSQIAFLLLVSAFGAIAFAIINSLTSGPVGRVLRAIREDEDFAKSLGKNTCRFKIAALAISAGLAAGAGGLYAHYLSFIDPTSFTLTESILVVSMIMIGGAGTKWGPILGAFVIVTIPELLRFAGLPAPIAAHSRQTLYGILLVVMIVVMPRGLLGGYGFGR